jgi:hypothetical protein
MLETEWAIIIDFTKAQARAKAITTTINHEGAPRPAFIRASQNMVAAATPLDPPLTGRIRCIAS